MCIPVPIGEKQKGILVVCAVPSAQARFTFSPSDKWHDSPQHVSVSDTMEIFFKSAESSLKKKSFLCNHKAAPWHEKRMQQLPAMSLTLRIKMPLGCFWKKNNNNPTIISVKYQIRRQFISILSNKRESRADRDILDIFSLLPYGVWINYLRFGDRSGEYGFKVWR